MRLKATVLGSVITLLVCQASVFANWLETFDNGELDLTTWQFLSYPEITGTLDSSIRPGVEGNDYLGLLESSSVSKGGSAFALALGSDEAFADVRVGAVVNVAGDASHSYCGLGARAVYIMDDGSISGYPGMIASAYIMHVSWDQGPANLRINVEKVVSLSNIMDQDYEVAVPGLNHARSYYAELDVVGKDPAYVTGSLYEYQGGPLVARIPTLVDSSANDSWEDPGVQDEPFAQGMSGIFGQNENPEPPGFYVSFDNVSSLADGPSAVNVFPRSGASHVSINTVLEWAPAAFASSSQLWLGKPGMLIQVEPAPSGSSYDPGELELGQTYQWRVDQVGPSGVVPGHVWTFTTGDCMVVDGFDSYVDSAEIAAEWPHNIPGGYDYLFLESAQVFQGAQALRFEYQNQAEPFFTEATRTFAELQDWTAHRAGTLSLSLYGQRDNVEQPLYVQVEDAGGKHARVMQPYAHAPQAERWVQWDIDLAQFADVDLTQVKKITLGTGDGAASSQADQDVDMIYIDSIRICPAQCQEALAADLNGDCIVDFSDFALMASDWLKSGL
jgi:uncharacterized protein YuzB (UPF0349 family)